MQRFNKPSAQRTGAGYSILETILETDPAVPDPDATIGLGIPRQSAEEVELQIEDVAKSLMSNPRVIQVIATASRLKGSQ